MKAVSLESLRMYLHQNKVYLLDGENMWVYNGKSIRKVKFMPKITE